MEHKNEIVKQYILDNIKKRIYCGGQMIESEHQLAITLDVSRVTIRKALEDLTNQNILYKVRGKGTFVSIRSQFANFRLGVAFSQEVMKRGMKPSSRNVSVKQIKADTLNAKALQVDIGEDLWRIQRVRYANEQAVSYEETYYLYAMMEDLTKEICQQSIYSYLKNKGLELCNADQQIEAVSCDEHIAKKLKIPVGTPLIKMYVIAYMKNGVPITCGTSYYRSDIFSLVQSVRIEEQ